ncbi:amidohydrolase family protein [uncultured Desulfuromusa sp.]|uniref:amidohydrolase family protein n=1 Tax=uncultured Desulfuromusa sp. TaxID=219183 RepID=UPI002AA88955|nr:amidohydrolase family protein [uncultured Desulfuromusa sp.]
MFADIDLSTVKIFDGHMHIIDKRFPLVENDGFLPDEFTTIDYLARAKTFTLVGGAVVSGSFQCFDQTYLLDALDKLGPSFVGVTQLPVTVTDQELIRLAEAGVRAVRFNVKRGGSEELAHLEEMAVRVHELVNWHVELYIDSSNLGQLENRLIALPAVCIDHLGLSKKGFSSLLRLVEKGVKVKCTGFGRVDFDVKQALKDIYSANPAALIFGTDQPSTRAPRPYSDGDILMVIDALGDCANQVLSENALQFYAPKKR